jgi:Putative GTPase activating protein for Arf/Inhibitor of Apoptosis domain
MNMQRRLSASLGVLPDLPDFGDDDDGGGGRVGSGGGDGPEEFDEYGVPVPLDLDALERGLRRVEREARIPRFASLEETTTSVEMGGKDEKEVLEEFDAQGNVVRAENPAKKLLVHTGGQRRARRGSWKPLSATASPARRAGIRLCPLESRVSYRQTSSKSKSKSKQAWLDRYAAVDPNGRCVFLWRSERECSLLPVSSGDAIQSPHSASASPASTALAKPQHLLNKGIIGHARRRASLSEHARPPWRRHRDSAPVTPTANYSPNVSRGSPAAVPTGVVRVDLSLATIKTPKASRRSKHPRQVHMFCATGEVHALSFERQADLDVWHEALSAVALSGIKDALGIAQGTSRDSTVLSPNGESSSGRTAAAVAALQVARLDGNRICVDCSEPDPEWASINLGVFICIACSGVHRKLGTDISRVRSLTLDDWSYSTVAFMKMVGNANFNAVWEAVGIGSGENERAKPTPQSSRAEKSAFIRDKYERQKFKRLLTDSGTGKTIVRFPDFADVKTRQSSFDAGGDGDKVAWPHVLPTSDACAEAGLFHDPRKEPKIADVARCFACGAMLCDWEPSDEPMQEHAKVRPDCPFIRHALGDKAT